MKAKASSGKTGALATLLASTFVALSLPNAAQANTASTEGSAVYGLLFEQAAMWRERNRFDLAAQSLRKILESQPDNAEALFQLGSIELQNQDFDGVRQTIARLKQVDPADPRAAELERAMSVGQTDEVSLGEARRLAAGGAYDRAIAAYQRAFRGGPPPFDLAVEYYETLAGTPGGWEEARLRLKALAERSYATSRVKFAYARVLTYNEPTRREGIALLANLAGDPAVGQAAFDAMRQAMLWLSIQPRDRPFYESYLRRFPGDTAMRDKLAGLLRPAKEDPLAAAVIEAYRLSDRGLNDQAVARFEGILQSDPNYADAVAGIGIVRLRQERFVDARDQLTKAMKLAPERQAEWAQALDTANFWASYREAVTLRDRGDVAQAEKLIRPLADRKGQERAVAQALMADLLRRQGKQREAETYYRDALAGDPTNKDALVGLYQVMSAQGRDTRNEPLLANLDAATRSRIQADSAQESADRLRTQAKGVANTAPERAEALLRQAMQLDPSNPWIRYDLAKLLAKSGRVAEAQPLIDELVSSGRPESLFAAAVYYSEQQRTGEAIALLDQIPANRHSAQMTALRNDLRNAGDLDQLVASAKAGDAAARATIVSRANASGATPVQLANAALALAKIGDRQQSMALVRRLAGRRDLPNDALQLMFYASLEAGDDNEANAILARMSRGTANRDVADLKESLAIRQADRLREQKNLTAAYDALVPYVSGPSPSVQARLALARVYKDSNYTEEAIQVLDGIMVSKPADASTLQEAVNIAIDLRKYERADVWLAEALRLQPQNPRLYLVQARLLRARGDTAGARRALETAQQLNRGVGRQSEAAVPAPADENTTRVAAAGDATDAAGAKDEVASLRPDGLDGDAQIMAELERRFAARRASSANETVARAEVVSLDRPTRPIVPAVLTAQAPLTRPVRDDAPRPAPIQTAQIQTAQITLVPLRRPGDSSSSSSGGAGGSGSTGATTTPASLTSPPLPSPPSAPSASPADTDPLSREITRELTALKRDSATTVEAGFGYRGRSGESGFGRLNDLSIPLKGRVPVGNVGLSASVMPVVLDAGAMATDAATLSRFGSNALLPTANVLAPGSLQATGIALGLGFDWGRLSFDVGSSPIGFPVSNIVGGITWNQPLGDTMNLKLEASRRAVTDSLLSYAGTTDPASGEKWGGVVRSGGEVIGSYDDGSLGIYAKFAYGYYTGWNVATNQSYEMTTGAYYRPFKDDNSELKIGINGTYLSYNQNQNFYTLGQGGYYSPQQFFSLTFPVDWNEATGRFKYNAGGAIGLQTQQQNAAPYFPNNYALQNAAYNSTSLNGTLPPVYPSISNTGIAFGLHLGFEYAVTDRTSIGGKANFDNSYQYDQGTILLFLRSALN